ncbi:MAG: hypothetical protein JJT75_06725 [Opitutales bacterium]|nr:hypothetical protein [Opitutales bacterium]
MSSRRIDSIVAQIKALEKELIRESRNKETRFCYSFHQKKAKFTQAAKSRHRLLRLNLSRYFTRSKFFNLLSAPIIWMCLIPLVLLDVFVTLYQAICFPIYGIPKVIRDDYISFDRHRLSYLNFMEKLNCEYCAYANGILAYATEIAGRTEQHWCPIKHAGCSKCTHSRYHKFIDYGDAEKYRRDVEILRRSYEDIPTGKSNQEPPDLQ